MSTKLENNEQEIQRLLHITKRVQQGNIDLQHIENISKGIKGLTYSAFPAGSTVEEEHADKDISMLRLNQHKLELKVNELERRLNIQASDKIEELAKATFAGIPIIEKAYVKFEQFDVLLVIVYNSESISNAIEVIQPGLAKLENEFPGMYFKPQIFHTNEIHKMHHRQSKIIFRR